jgi:hypothetical protein
VECKSGERKGEKKSTRAPTRVLLQILWLSGREVRTEECRNDMCVVEVQMINKYLGCFSCEKKLREVKVQNDVRANFLGGDGKGKTDDVNLTGYLRSLPRQDSESRLSC